MKNKNQSQEISTSVGLKLEKDSSFYNDFIVPLKSNRQLSNLTQNILEAYYNDEELRKHIDSVIKYNTIPEKTKRRINELSSELEKSTVTAKVLQSILTSEQIDNYDSITFNKENPFDSVGILDHMKNILPPEIKEKTERVLGKKVYELENQVEELQQKLSKIDNDSLKYINNPKSYSENHSNDNIEVNIDTVENMEISEDDIIVKNGEDIIIDDDEANDEDIIIDDDEANSEDIIIDDDEANDEDVVIDDEANSEDIIIDDDEANDEDIVIDNDEANSEDVINKNDSLSNKEKKDSVPLGFSKICNSANVKVR
ncbi:hypothetical protein Q3304_08740 [Clostridioides sp. GD02377]|uniref:hypothetical protein n=1 Tax=unclassified Clostridioides TaxID=2635829 RepID=UPI0038B09692